MIGARFALIAMLGISLAASAAARPGIYEYWKAGTKRGHPRTDLPQGRSPRRRADVPAPRATSAIIPPWTESWFADSERVRRHVAQMVLSITVPMIGENYPLPRGGGFVCSQAAGGESASGGLTCLLTCTGPELGGRRVNRFYGSESGADARLDQVRWLIAVPPSSPAGAWRPFYRALVDSLSQVMGPPSWVGPDSTEGKWSVAGRTTRVRLHGAFAHPDSLVVECVSDRLAQGAPAP